jgi:TPR repeat protein
MRSRGMWFEPFDASLIELSGQETDWSRYLALVKLGVQAGDDRAMYALGSLMLSGSTKPKVVRNRAEGLRLLRRATRSVPMAMLEYAVLLESGVGGVEKDEQLAFAMFKRAERYGSVAARFHVARCLLAGTGVAVDRRGAARRLKRCLELGWPREDVVEELLRVASGATVEKTSRRRSRGRPRRA